MNKKTLIAVVVAAVVALTGTFTVYHFDLLDYVHPSLSKRTDLAEIPTPPEAKESSDKTIKTSNAGDRRKAAAKI